MGSASCIAKLPTWLGFGLGSELASGLVTLTIAKLPTAHGLPPPSKTVPAKDEQRKPRRSPG